MKAKHFILPVAAGFFVCGTSICQHRTLAALKEEIRSLEMSLANSQTADLSTPSPAANMQLSSGESMAMFPEAEAAFFAIVRSAEFTPEMEERFFLATRALDVPSLTCLMAALKAHPDLPPEHRQHFEIRFATLLAAEQPEKAFAILQDMPKPPSEGKELCYAFRQWLAKVPATAAAWFETELRKDNPLTADAELRRQAIQALFRADPDRGLDLALSILPAAPDAREINKLAAETVLTLADEREHASYLAALRRAGEKSPENPLLAEIRATYLNELPARLKGWSFGDVTALVDGELSAAEKLVTARILSTFPDLDEPAKWADWFARTGGTLDGTHPIMKYLGSWSLADFRAAGQWLDCYPEGAAKEKLVREHASRIRYAAPEEAAWRAATLPPSPQRDELLAEIRSVWEKKDPAAAERFAREKGLAD